VHDVSSGVIVSNRTLVVQRVRRGHSGHFVCSAENSEGRSESNPIELKIKCEFLFPAENISDGNFVQPDVVKQQIRACDDAAAREEADSASQNGYESAQRQ